MIFTNVYALNRKKTNVYEIMINFLKNSPKKGERQIEVEGIFDGMPLSF